MWRRKNLLSFFVETGNANEAWSVSIEKVNGNVNSSGMTFGNMDA